jgi:hypothetical protein
MQKGLKHNLINIKGEVKMHGGNYFNENKKSIIRSNIEKYAWAKELAAQTTEKADRMLKFGERFWWTLPTPQELPRSSNPCQTNYGCPVCGEEILLKYGATGWIHLIEDNPWKTQCPNCKSIFPANDFKSYYESGLDERGIFRKELADKSFLVNTLYPDKGEDYFVDDGTGYTDANGIFWSFIPQYIHYAIWLDVHNIGGTDNGFITNGLKHLSEAWIYTGDLKYALYVLMILYKVSMVYPDMDLNLYMRLPGRPYRNSDGFSLQGKVVGSIWETFSARIFCYAADAVLPVLREYPQEVTSFFKDVYPTDPETIEKSILDGIVRQVYKEIKNARIAGNEGMHQSALAMAAVCMGLCDESREWLDFLFKPGKRILEQDPIMGLKGYFTGCNVFGVLENKVNGDGLGDECSLMYNRLWMVEFARLADILSAYPGIAGSKYDLKTHPVMKKMYKSYVPFVIDNDYIPKTGDTGKTGNPMKVFDGDNLQKFLWDGYRVTKDKGILDLFNISYPMAKEGTFGFIDIENPEEAARILQEAKDPKSPMHERSHNMTDYGNALLRQRVRHGCNVHMYYGRTMGHGHLDKMNFEIIAYGMNFSPDHGYPEYAENIPSRYEWTSNTVSHNTVMVDRAGQLNTKYAGIPLGYEDGKNIKFIDAEDVKAYEQVSMYRRTLCLVDITPDKAYIVDFFRVAGGSRHEISFHGGEGEVKIKGVSLIDQPSGTLKGEDVPYGEVKGFQKGGGRKRGDGYSFLYDVRKSEVPTDYVELTYELKDTWGMLTDKNAKPYLKVYMPGRKHRTVIAKGKPPTNKIGNPKFLYYYLGERKGNDLKSRFVSVYEPFLNEGFIRSAELSPVNNEKESFERGCVKITLLDGSVDYVIHSVDDVEMNINNIVTFQGRFGFLRVKDGKVKKAFMWRGSRLAYNGNTLLEMNKPFITGTVKDFQKEISDEHWVDLVLEKPIDSLEDVIGRYVYIDGNDVGNAVYEILGVEKTREPNTYRFNTAASPVRGYVDDCDPSKGYIYRFGEGAKAEIPLYCERDFEE